MCLYITCFKTKRDDLTLARQIAPQTCVCVCSRKNCHTIERQGANDFSVFTGHSFNSGHEFLVFALCVVDQTHGRLGNARQHFYFAGVVHAQLNHRTTVRDSQVEQSQWHANLIVQITLSRHRCLRRICAQHRSNHLSHSCFAIATGHTNEWQIKLTTPLPCQLAQSLTCIGHIKRWNF